MSVIEARNVLADEYAELNFYVKLKVGPNEVRTDIIKGTSRPKFLKDCRLVVPCPETDYLQIELMQVGPRGDLVVGSEELRVLTITSRGTIVHWFELKTASHTKTAELCLVIRYLSAGANRPMSPSYAIAARQARERALDAAPPVPDPLILKGPSKALFSEEPSLTSKAAALTGTAAAAAAGPAAPRFAPTTPSHSSTSISAAARISHSAAASPAITGAGQRGAAPPAAGPAAPADMARRGSQGFHMPGWLKVHKLFRLPRRLPGGDVPLPMAILSGVFVGAFVYIWKKRPVYVASDDSMCHAGSCSKQRMDRMRRRHQDTLVIGDAILYPGDRIRIR